MQDGLGKTKCIKTQGPESSKCLRCMNKPVWLEFRFKKGLKCARWLGPDCDVCELEPGRRDAGRVPFPMYALQRKKCKISLVQEVPKANS